MTDTPVGELGAPKAADRRTFQTALGQTVQR